MNHQGNTTVLSPRRGSPLLDVFWENANLYSTHLSFISSISALAGMI